MDWKRPILAAAAGLALAATVAGADVKLPALFGDNMVLQQNMHAPVWGWADPGERVTVSIKGKQASAVAEPDGKWMVRLAALSAGGPFEMTVQGKNTITIHNVLIGEVWVGSGQSNMAMSVQNSDNSKEEIAAASYPKIRLFTVPRTVSDKPETDVKGSWVECSPQTIPGFSAAAYFFGRKLHQDLKVPVGLIHSSWGGTPVESWTSKAGLDNGAFGKVIAERWQGSLTAYANNKANYEKQLAEWKVASEKAKAEGKAEPKAPTEPAAPNTNPYMPSGLYNAMIAPLIPYGIQGVIWYQGEANARRPDEYRELFPAMIYDWRKLWGEGTFPFLYVQLANWISPPYPIDWPELRQAQLDTLKVRRTGMALATDIGNPNDIHPKNKQEVGRRLALAAEATVYAMKIPYSGPIYDSMAVENNAIRLKFKFVEGGLVAKDGKLNGFVIAGADRKFVPADATIDGDSIIVRSEQVANPVAVRYGWDCNPSLSLYNAAQLPASPFRTDDWMGLQVEAK